MYDYDRRTAQEKWIQEAIKDPGALHRALGVPEGETIPVSKIKSELEKLKKKDDKSDADKKLQKQLQMALTLKGIKGSSETYRRGGLDDVDDGHWITPPQNQGQMIEVSYASDPYEGFYYMRVLDHADRSVEYYSTPIYDHPNISWEPQNVEPRIPDRKWKRMSSPPRGIRG